MFEKLSPTVEQAMQRANDVARELGHDYLGTEHLLLAMIADGCGPALEMLACRGVTPEAARAAVMQVVQPGAGAAVVGPLPPSPRFQQMMTNAIELTRSSGASQVEAAHVLRAMLQQPDGGAGAALNRLGVTPGDVAIPDPAAAMGSSVESAAPAAEGSPAASAPQPAGSAEPAPAARRARTAKRTRPAARKTAAAKPKRAATRSPRARSGARRTAARKSPGRAARRSSPSQRKPTRPKGRVARRSTAKKASRPSSRRSSRRRRK